MLDIIHAGRKCDVHFLFAQVEELCERQLANANIRPLHRERRQVVLRRRRFRQHNVGICRSNSSTSDVVAKDSVGSFGARANHRRTAICNQPLVVQLRLFDGASCYGKDGEAADDGVGGNCCQQTW